MSWLDHARSQADRRDVPDRRHASRSSLGGIFALLVRAELVHRGKTLMDADTYNRMFTLHGVVMVFLFIIPSIPAAMGNIILPIQLGAKDVAFPRLNLLELLHLRVRRLLRRSTR